MRTRFKAFFFGTALTVLIGTQGAIGQSANTDSKVSESAQAARDLEAELRWFAQVLDHRFTSYFNQGRGDSDPEGSEPARPEPPDLSGSDSAYADFVKRHGFGWGERFTLVLTLVPELRPRLLDYFSLKNTAYDTYYTEFGGRRDAMGRYIPTGETVCFILGGDDLKTRFEVMEMLGSEHLFAKLKVLGLSEPNGGSVSIRSPLVISPGFLRIFCGLSSGAAVPRRAGGEGKSP